MNLFSGIKSWSEKFESKIAKFLALWGTIGAIIAVIPSIAAGIYFFYVLVIDLSTFSADKKKLELGMNYEYFCAMQSQSIDHEEMDSDTLYGVILQKTNHGDLYYCDTITINGVVRPIIYSANVKKKASREGYHVNITDMYGNVRWIEPTIK